MAFLHLMLLALNSPLFIPVALAGEPAPNAGLAAVSVETGKGGLESQETRITQIARSIVRDRITSSVERRSLEVEEGWMTHIAYDMAKEIGFSQARIEAEKQRLRKRQEAREAMRSSLVDNATVAGIAVGIGIVFLILRGILRMFNRQTETPEGRQRRRMAQKVKTDPEALAVFVRAGSEEEAAAIGHCLVEKRLAAGVSITENLQSLCPEKGEIKQGSEVLLMIGTRRPRLKKLVRHVEKLHSGGSPEIIPFSMLQTSKPYLEWLQANTCRRFGWRRLWRLLRAASVAYGV